MHKKIGFYIIISFITHIAISGYSLYYIYVLDKYKLFSFSLLLVADASVCHFFALRRIEAAADSFSNNWCLHNKS